MTGPLRRAVARLAVEVEALRPRRMVWVWPRIIIPGAGPVLVSEEEADRPMLYIPGIGEGCPAGELRPYERVALEDWPYPPPGHTRKDASK